MKSNLVGNPLNSKRHYSDSINSPLKGNHNTLQASLSINDYQRLNRFIIEGLNTAEIGCIPKRQCISMSFSVIQRHYLKTGGIGC